MASPSHRSRHVPCPSNPVLLEAQSQWLFTDDELERTPSQLDGMKPEAENTSRSKGVNFIMQVGIMLKLPQLTLATAAVFLHRFFMRYSMVDLPQRQGMHPYPIAATSLFLATKVEENVRKMKELVVACCRVAQKQPNLVVDEQSKEFWKWRDTILHHEDLLLEALCFDLQLEQPYRQLYEFICFFGANENKPLRNASWAFVNDSGFTVLCLQYPARTIAAAALYAAARHCEVAFEDDDLGRPWWEQIDVDLDQVRHACTKLARLYEYNAAQKPTQNYAAPIASDDGADKTRLSRPRSQEASINGRKRSREPEDAGEELKVQPNGRQSSPKRQRLSPCEGDQQPQPSSSQEPAPAAAAAAAATPAPATTTTTTDQPANGTRPKRPSTRVPQQPYQPPHRRIPKEADDALKDQIKSEEQKPSQTNPHAREPYRPSPALGAGLGSQSQPDETSQNAKTSSQGQSVETPTSTAKETAPARLPPSPSPSPSPSRREEGDPERSEEGEV